MKEELLEGNLDDRLEFVANKRGISTVLILDLGLDTLLVPYLIHTSFTLILGSGSLLSNSFFSKKLHSSRSFLIKLSVILLASPAA